MIRLLSVSLLLGLSIIILSYSLLAKSHKDKKSQNTIIKKSERKGKNRCYKCSGVKYVCYKGKDTFLKRRKATKLCKTRVNQKSFYCIDTQCNTWIK